MKKNKMMINIILSLVIFILGIVILFIDSDTLNSLYVDNYDFVISYVNTASSDKEIVEEKNNNEESKVVEVTNNVNSTNVSLVNNVVNKWVWPTDANYIITSGYGYRWGSMHDAIDISGPLYGSSIYAANSGIVVSVKGGCVAGDLYCNGRGGNYIIIRHNEGNYHTIYMHLKDIYVSNGGSVVSGQVIGSMGNTGNVRPIPSSSNPYLGTHLHFGLYIGEPYRGGYSVNPMSVY